MTWRVYASFGADGEPKGQPRARRRAPDGSARKMYDPGTADPWKELLWLAARPFIPPEPLKGPICLRVHFNMPRPKRLMRRRDPDGPVPHLGKPDVDNMLKALMDCLTTIGMWRDDTQVCDCAATKQYHEKGGQSGAVVTIYRGEEE